MYINQRKTEKNVLAVLMALIAIVVVINTLNKLISGFLYWKTALYLTYFYFYDIFMMK
jgi:hypothetical protein